ncbi:transporter substrate-binding protein [Paracoccus sulfuroxidans]|uniref:Amino acid/amide ABC transporter substrate-binding protein (HAAT family) n=1 Tax=Paracoccus sulfuroxidans TaxID=384678 RepID=A0A562NUX0_9RHOB|nr:transporter substrate-binding protein [Paracoccus sulfuroxidans]TWI35992.1 amino acid/amide ABC transporter substrate-binding protein (HAAT family) [Paracoccus sulfuroxidans]
MKRNDALAERDDIPVGVIFSATGHLSVIEKSSIDVTLYALDRINRAGGIGGRPVTPYFFDACSDVRTYALGIGELIREHGVLCTFGGYTSASRRAMLPTVIASNHLLYLPTCWEGKECVQNIIYTGPVANQHSVDLIPFMIRNFGPRACFIGSDYVWPRETNAVARVWMDRNKGEVLSEQYLPLGVTDVSDALGLIRAEAPDFIFSTLVGNSALALYREYTRLGFDRRKTPIASLTTSEAEVRAMGSDIGEGHILAAPYFQSLQNPTNAAFVHSFLASPYGETGVTHFNLENTYLAVLAFEHALNACLETKDWAHLTANDIRNASAGLALGNDVSPEGHVWIDPDNFCMAFVPKIGRCGPDGQFEILQSSIRHVQPDPYALYPERGICRRDGLHTPDGMVVPNALY